MSIIRLYKQRRPKLGRIAKRVVHKMIRDERGQSTAEYILMLSVVVLIALRFKKAFTSKIADLSNKIFGKMNEAIDEEP